MPSPPATGSTPLATPDDDNATLIFRDRLQALYRLRLESVASGLAVGAVLSAALLRVYSWPTVLLWYAGVVLVQSGRGALMKLSRFKPDQANDPVRWSRRYMTDVVIAGAYWGLSMAAFVKPTDLMTQSFIAMALGGMAVGSITVHAYHRPVMYAFLGCLLLPFIGRVALIGDFAHLFLALGMALLTLYLAVFGRFHAGTLERSIALRHENRELIAQLKAEREAAVRLQAKAEEASQSKSRFFAGASHDLRQPLHALGLYASVLQGESLPPDLHQASLRVGQSVRVLEELFEGVLDIAHIEAGGMAISREPVQVALLMERALLLFSGEALDKGLSIKYARCRAWVLGDPLALQRIVSNLVANAVRHTQRGQVLVGARRRGAHLRLMVLDTGPGVEAAARERIFEEFYRLPSATGQGFGLGLATVKRLCDAAGYALGLESVVGRGTCFWVELPITAARPPARASEPLADSPGGALAGTLGVGHSSGPQLRLLLIEDDEAARAAVHTVLQSWGHRCLAFEAPQQALDWLAENPHDHDFAAVISDYNLPGEMDGLALIAAVRATCGQALPALLISGSITPALRSQALAAQCIALAKPVKPLQLRAVLAQIGAQPTPKTSLATTLATTLATSLAQPLATPHTLTPTERSTCTLAQSGDSACPALADTRSQALRPVSGTPSAPLVPPRK